MGQKEDLPRSAEYDFPDGSGEPNLGRCTIHGEQIMFGFDDPREASSVRWRERPEIRSPPIAGGPFFTITVQRSLPGLFHGSAVTFKLLYCFFIIGHDGRQILLFNLTRHSTSNWIVQQLREAFPCESAKKFLLFDHD